MMNRGKWLLGVVAVALLAGCAATTTQVEPAAIESPAKVEKKAVPQDPWLAVTTAEVMQLLTGPEAVDHVLVDVRPQIKFDEGHVPGALSIPQPILEQNLDRRPEAIDPEEFKKLVAEGKVLVVDVRSAEEFAAGHLPGAIHIVDEDFIFKAEESVAKLPKEGRVVLQCATGARAGGAYYTILDESDYVNKKNLQYLEQVIVIHSDGTFVIE